MTLVPEFDAARIELNAAVAIRSGHGSPQRTSFIFVTFSNIILTATIIVLASHILLDDEILTSSRREKLHDESGEISITEKTSQ